MIAIRLKIAAAKRRRRKKITIGREKYSRLNDFSGVCCCCARLGVFSLLSCDYEVNCAEERDVAMFHALSSIYVARFAPSLFRFAFSPLSEPVETWNHLSTGPFLYLIVLLRSSLRRGISNDFLLLIERKLRWKLFNSHNLIVIVLTYAREIFSKPKSFLFVYGRVGGIFFLASTTEK